jgi:hypothetical protein
MVGHKKSICSHSKKRFSPLTKAQKRRSPGSPKDSPKTIDVKASNKRKTLWMKFLFVVHCENKKLNKDVKYKDSMIEAGALYHTKKFEALGKHATEAQLHEFVKANIRGAN